MAFRVKDLLINVVSASEAKRALGNCRATVWTVPALLQCRRVRHRYDSCVSAGIAGFVLSRDMVGPGPVGPGDPVEWVEQLAILKAELKEALEEVERQEAAPEQAMKPATSPKSRNWKTNFARAWRSSNDSSRSWRGRSKGLLTPWGRNMRRACREFACGQIPSTSWWYSTAFRTKSGACWLVLAAIPIVMAYSARATMRV